MADPTQLTDEDVGLANVILTNGARFYVDHAHPEYSGPECTNPRDALIWDRAGERIMAEASRRALQVPNTPPINLYKNNTDNKGASYGTHENYLMRRETPFADIVRHLTPFFVSRQVVTGSGRVGIGQDGRGDGFQISQRADFFEVEVGLETTLKRPIINTRDEPHAVAEKYRRLHVIIGDANLAEVSTYLKLGTTALVLAMIEDQFLSVDLTVDRPVATLHAVSHDPTLRELVTLRSGRTLTAVQLQMEYAEQARKYVEDRFGSDADPVTADVLDRWESVLGRLETDPMSLSRELDWVAKLQILEGYRQPRRAGLGVARGSRPSTCSTPTCGRTRGCTTGSRRPAGSTGSSPTPRSTARSPSRREDTRAYFRGRCLAKYPDEVAAASWDSVIFDLPGHDSLQRVPDPRAAARHQGARRRPAGPLRHRRPAGRRPHRRLTARIVGRRRARADSIPACGRTRSGTSRPPSATTRRAPACSRRRCWDRPSTASPTSPVTAGRSSSRSGPAGWRSRWPSEACRSPASSSPRPMVEQLRTKVDEATIPVVMGDMATAVAPGRVLPRLPGLQHDLQPADPGRAGRVLPQRGPAPRARWPVRDRAVGARAAEAAAGSAGHGVAVRDGYIGLDTVRRPEPAASSRTTSASTRARQAELSAGARTATSGRPSST